MPPKFSILDDTKTPDRSVEPKIQKFPKAMMKGSKSDQSFLNFGGRTEKGISVDTKQVKHAPLFKPSLQPQMTLNGVSIKGNRQAQWDKTCRTDAKSEILDFDRQLVHSILVKRVNKDDTSKGNNRSDVVTKKVLRAARHFFDMKIEENVKFKKRKGKAMTSFLTYTDTIVDEFFNPVHLRLLGVASPSSLSNYLAAFVQPKCLLRELDSISKDIKLLRTMGKDGANLDLEKQETSVTKKNLLSSWDNDYKSYVVRMSEIEKNILLPKDLLYYKYSKR